MQTVTKNRIINYLLYLLFCFIFASGLLLEFRLGHGPAGNLIWGWDRHEWGNLHALAGYLSIVLIAIHIFIHLNWLKNIACQKKSFVLFGALLFGIAIFLIVLLGPQEEKQRRYRNKNAYYENNFDHDEHSYGFRRGNR